MNIPKHKNRRPNTSPTQGRFNSIEGAVVASQVAEVAKDAGEAARKNRATPAPDTIVEAKIDVGFGNALFIRGEGAGLNWEKGQPLNCIDGSTWVWSTKQAKDKVLAKLLLNDQAWGRGENLEIQAGQKIQIAPQF